MPLPAADIPLTRFDWAIKTILRDKANFDVLEGFLSALLGEDIIIEQVLESESNIDDGSEFNHLGMLVRDHQGRKFIIEIHNEWENDYLERLQFGTAKVVVDNIALRGAYCNVVKVVSIHIIYVNTNVGDDYVYKSNTEFNGVHISEELEVRKHAVVPIDSKFSYRDKNFFPEYYLIYVESFKDIIESPLDEWIYFLKHSAVRGDFHARHIDKAMNKLALLKMPPAERHRYEDYVKSLVIERDVIETARQEGIKEGIQEGQQQERLRIARSLLDLVNDDLVLAEKTGLSVAGVQQLRIMATKTST